MSTAPGGGWGWTESLYFCIVTLSTVGLGDYDPIQHVNGSEAEYNRMIALIAGWFLFIIIGLGFVGVLITSIREMVGSAKVLKHLTRED